MRICTCGRKMPIDQVWCASCALFWTTWIFIVPGLRLAHESRAAMIASDRVEAMNVARYVNR